jgi:hypothetical protein
MPPEMKYITACIVALLLFGAVGLAAYYGYGHWRVRESRSWGSTTGRVLESGAAWETVEESNRMFLARVIYEYQVNDRPYRNGRIFLQPNTNSDATATAARFPAGAQVPVYYNPADPAQSVLVRNAPSTQLYIGLIVLLLALAVMMCGLYWLISFIVTL